MSRWAGESMFGNMSDKVCCKCNSRTGGSSTYISWAIVKKA